MQSFIKIHTEHKHENQKNRPHHQLVKDEKWTYNVCCTTQVL